MKRIAVILTALGVLASWCFAQDNLSAAQKGGTPPPITKKVMIPLEVRGTIENIILPEPSKNIRPEIALSGEDGKSYTFLIRSTTTIYGQDWKAISIDKLAKGKQVRVQYITNKDGFLVAQSIKPVRMKK
ncbi:MAG TPA: hypothetical protein VMU10_03130 [Desulfomonilia bacterium]|nr:hypothetical protein [Desulfomonilia bacterium]